MSDEKFDPEAIRRAWDKVPTREIKVGELFNHKDALWRVSVIDRDPTTNQIKTITLINPDSPESQETISYEEFLRENPFEVME